MPGKPGAPLGPGGPLDPTSPFSPRSPVSPAKGQQRGEGVGGGDEREGVGRMKRSEEKTGEEEEREA